MIYLIEWLSLWLDLEFSSSITILGERNDLNLFQGVPSHFDGIESQAHSPQQSDNLFCIHRGRHVISDVTRGATVHGIIINENHWDV